MPKLDTRTITTLGLLVAMEIVCARFLSIQAWNFRIGFSFVPIVIAARLYGPVPAAVVAGIADVIGALLFPTGAYFPGFTLTACLMGITFGLFLHKAHTTWNIAAAVLINQFIWSLLLNTYWISVLYGSSFTALLATRILQACLLTVVQIAAIYWLAVPMHALERRLA